MSLDTLTDTPKRRGRPPRIPPAPPSVDAAPPSPPADAAAQEPIYSPYDIVPKPKMVSVRLLKHYRPAELPDPQNKGKFLPPNFEVVGHWTDEVTRKMPDGKMRVITPSEFVSDEIKPAPQPGVGGVGKIWAGTIIRVTTDEAKAMRKSGTGEIEIDD